MDAILIDNEIELVGDGIIEQIIKEKSGDNYLLSRNTSAKSVPLCTVINSL
jgi:hypothetical protein